LPTLTTEVSDGVLGSSWQAQQSEYLSGAVCSTVVKEAVLVGVPSYP